MRREDRKGGEEGWRREEETKRRGEMRGEEAPVGDGGVEHPRVRRLEVPGEHVIWLCGR